jgi:hypothetical protein
VGSSPDLVYNNKAIVVVVVVYNNKAIVCDSTFVVVA